MILLGCATVGPRSAQRDRFDYNTAIANSRKEQTLFNIAKIRYADMPLFVEVASVVAGYTMETQVNAGASFPSKSILGGDIYHETSTPRSASRSSTSRKLSENR